MDDAMAQKIRDWASAQNLKLLQDEDELARLINCVFQEGITFPDGTTKEQVEAMTQFQQIGVLEQLIRKEDDVFVEPLSDSLRVGINIFLRRVNKAGFETATDMELAREYPVCPHCNTRGSVGPSHVGFTFYCYECCGTFP
ncbi:hypothetical protein CL630_01440 [bacterium]|nr:hypothetical protein [bacterium]|tara:strand:+ start:20616 stop:21038 length:423 start_codon:yes stop_codon:yes gene_type:complete